MRLSDPIQFIATSRHRAIETLVHQHSVRPYYRDSQIPTTLTFNYPEQFRSGRRPTIPAEELRLFQARGLMRRELMMEVTGVGQVEVTFSRLDQPEKSRRAVFSLAAVDTDAVGVAIAAFLATDADPAIPGVAPAAT